VSSGTKRLRRYQLDRLRYYYAIIKFSSKEVAKHVYDLVDGVRDPRTLIPSLVIGEVSVIGHETKIKEVGT
jgi:hypothetical protein